MGAVPFMAKCSACMRRAAGRQCLTWHTRGMATLRAQRHGAWRLQEEVGVARGERS